MRMTARCRNGRFIAAALCFSAKQATARPEPLISEASVEAAPMWQEMDARMGAALSESRSFDFGRGGRP
jgi:hypothetical protein